MVLSIRVRRCALVKCRAVRVLRSLALPLAALTLIVAGAPSSAALPSASLRWTDKTPDDMVVDATSRALAPGAAEHAQAAAIVTIAALADRASYPAAREALERVGAAVEVGVEVRGEAALLSRALAEDEGTDSGSLADHALGVVDALAILGPFRDTGGGLDAHDGPEDGAPAFDPSGRYSWGAYEVAWRSVPRAFAGARGVPLDLFVFPRKESCSWVASRLDVATDRTFTVRAASTGQVRLVFDGVDVARDDSVNAGARIDRVAARVRASPGEHLVAAKVCSGALDDEGRVRLRIVDDAGRWPEGVRSSARAWDAGARDGHDAHDAHDDASARAKSDRGAGGARLSAARSLGVPLSRATGKPASDVDARLDAAILRTLGGADDLRSPRAPGLLSALADGGLDADRMAMVAWLAPSGANRGAWLNRARGAADPSTRAFVERRLVERHLEAQLGDWAMAALRGAHIEADDDGEARLLEAQVDLALGTDVLRVAAMRRLEAATTGSPNDVVDSLARLAEGLDPSVALRARNLLASRGNAGADLVRVLAATRGRGDAIRAATRAFADADIDDADDALAMAQTVARTGAHGDALALYEALARWAPNHAPVWAGMAEELAGTGARDEVVGVALRRARELDPGEARYRAEIALRMRAPTLGGESRDDEKYIVSSESILARRDADPVARDASDVADRQLHWLRAVVMHPDRRVSEMVHYAREIVIAPRTEDELSEEVPAEGDLTEILRARVHRSDGTTAFPVEETSDARPRIRWPELARGDVVEVAFRSWSAGPVGGRGDPPFYRLDYAGALSTHPVLYNEVVLESPRDRPVFVDVVNGKPDRREERDEESTHVVRLVWDRPINVPDEPLAPPLSEVIPTVVLSTFKDWSSFRAWYGEAVRGFTEPDAQVRDLAASLTKSRPTRDEKLRALFHFVADDIRYVNYVSGEWWLPNRPQQLLARREGDCDDKALLLITLLKAVGIDAQEVMVQTRMTAEPSIVRASHAAVPLFDHGIAFLPGPNGGTYLDATSPQSRLGPLPSMDARAVALRLDGADGIVELPASSPDDHGVDASWTIRLAADGGADIEGEERAVGDDAFWMRTYLTEPGARAQWIEERLASAWFSGVQVDKRVDFRGDLPRGRATARWRAKSDTLARREGSELVVALSPSQTLASQLAPLVRRTLPVWLPAAMAPRREARTIRVVAPPGWTFEPLPPRGDENGGPFGRAHFDVTRDPGDRRAVVARRVVVFDQSAISVEEYPRWRAWVQRVDALMHKAVRLVPTAAAR
jgi:transglutaminase-like putative cysteine protease